MLNCSPFIILTSNVWELHLLHILTNSTQITKSKCINPIAKTLLWYISLIAKPLLRVCLGNYLASKRIKLKQAVSPFRETELNMSMAADLQTETPTMDTGNSVNGLMTSGYLENRSWPWWMFQGILHSQHVLGFMVLSLSYLLFYYIKDFGCHVMVWLKNFVSFFSICYFLHKCHCYYWILFHAFKK